MTLEQKNDLLRERGVRIEKLPSGGLRLSNRANTMMVESMRHIREDDIATFGRSRSPVIQAEAAHV